MFKSLDTSPTFFSELSKMFVILYVKQIKVLELRRFEYFIDIYLLSIL